jgi:hypothetical protein
LNSKDFLNLFAPFLIADVIKKKKNAGFCRLLKYRLNENNYTVMKGKKCNEKSFSRDAHSDAGVSFQMQLLLEF